MCVCAGGGGGGGGGVDCNNYCKLATKCMMHVMEGEVILPSYLVPVQ